MGLFSLTLTIFLLSGSNAKNLKVSLSPPPMPGANGTGINPAEKKRHIERHIERHVQPPMPYPMPGANGTGINPAEKNETFKKTVKIIPVLELLIMPILVENKKDKINS